MKVKSVAGLLAGHSFFEDLPDADLQTVGCCGRLMVFHAGDQVAVADSNADAFYLVRSGCLVMSFPGVEGDEAVFARMTKGSLVGWSWLFPPHRWCFDVKADSLTRVVHFNGKCLREKCAEEPGLGFQLSKKFAALTNGRLQELRDHHLAMERRLLKK